MHVVMEYLVLKFVMVIFHYKYPEVVKELMNMHGLVLMDLLVQIKILLVFVQEHTQ